MVYYWVAFTSQSMDVVRANVEALVSFSCLACHDAAAATTAVEDNCSQANQLVHFKLGLRIIAAITGVAFLAGVGMPIVLDTVYYG